MTEVEDFPQSREERNARRWPVYREMVAKGDDPETSEAIALRTRMIEAYIYLAKMVVGKMKKTLPAHVERDDLESWAKIGLMQAVQRYDHTMSVPFEAFATQRMRSVIMDGIRDADWAPRSLRKKQRDIAKVEEAFKQLHGRHPTVSETATVIVTDESDESEFTWTEIEFADRVADVMLEIADTKYQAGIASHTYIEGNVEAQNKFASPNEEEDELVYLLKATVGKALEDMPIRKAAIVTLHYYQEKKLAEIASMLKMSEVKIGSLHAEAVMEIWDRVKSVISDEE